MPDASISVSRFAPQEGVGLVDEHPGREHGPYTLTWNGVAVGQAVPAGPDRYRVLPGRLGARAAGVPLTTAQLVEFARKLAGTQRGGRVLTAPERGLPDFTFLTFGPRREG